MSGTSFGSIPAGSCLITFKDGRYFEALTLHADYLNREEDEEDGYINLDFADVSTIMKGAGYAHMAIGQGQGKNKAEEAARMAVASPLMETSINGATGVLVNVTGSSELTLDDVETAAGIVQEAANPDANIIWGAGEQSDLDDEIELTIIATGFDLADATVPGAITVPAATFTQDPETGAWSVAPGTVTLTVTGTI